MIEGLSTHLYDPDVQKRGCSALFSLAARNAGNQARIFENGGVEAVASALRAHPEDSELQAVCCNVFAALAVNAESRSRMVMAGAVKLVAAALREHPQSIEVQRNGSCALAHLSASAASGADKRQIAEAGGLEALV